MEVGDTGKDWDVGRLGCSFQPTFYNHGKRNKNPVVINSNVFCWDCDGNHFIMMELRECLKYLEELGLFLAQGGDIRVWNREHGKEIL